MSSLLLILPASLFLTVALVKVLRPNRSRLSFHLPLQSVAARMLPYSPSLLEIRNEMERARRYQRRFSVAVLKCSSLDPSSANGGPSTSPRNGAGPASFSGQAAVILAGSLLRSSLRAQDLVTYRGDQNDYILLLAESNLQQAQLAVDRLSRLVMDRLQLDLEAGLAEFPSTAFTLKGLVQGAEKACGKSLIKFRAHRPASTGTRHARTATSR